MAVNESRDSWIDRNSCMTEREKERERERERESNHKESCIS